MRYQGQSIAVLGLGESGEAAAVLLAEEGAKVTVLDSAEAGALQRRAENLRRFGISLVSGSAAEQNGAHYDFAVLSPGIDPATPLVQGFLAKGTELIGELELAYRSCICPVVAITGSNGKTTTTQLTAKILNEGGLPTVAAGNISPAFSAVVRKSAELALMTLEVSSFQLETIQTFRPRVAAYLNLSPNHLDRYPSMKEYRTAKLRLFKNQTEDDFAVVNYREPLPPLTAKKITFSAYERGGDFEYIDEVIHFRGQPVLRMSDALLRGTHNAENIMAAMAIGWTQGLAFEAMAQSVRTYKAPPHRCESVRVLDGVEWVNDSKSTSLDSLEKALEAEKRPVVLIAGGKDKGNEFDPVADLVGRKCHAAILIGEMAHRIARSWGDKVPCTVTGSLQEAVQVARNHAQPGDAVLFSPGTSSYDMFKSYIDRGDQFRAIVQAL